MAVPDPSQPSPPAGSVAWRPSEYLTPSEIAGLQYHWNEIVKVRGILAAGGFRFEKELREFLYDDTIDAYRCEMGHLENKGKWVAAAALAQYAMAQGFRSVLLYLSGADALAKGGLYREARELLLQGEDLLLDPAGFDYTQFHYALTCYECRLGNLDLAEEKLKQLNHWVHWVRGRALNEPDLEPLRNRIPPLPKQALPEPIRDDVKPDSGPSPCLPVSITPEQEEASRRFDEAWDKGMARGREMLAEAERVGIPLHYLIPVN